MKTIPPASNYYWCQADRMVKKYSIYQATHDLNRGLPKDV